MDVVEGAPPVKQVMPSPVLMERLKQAALAGRKGEVILLGLQMTGGGRDNESSFALLVEIVRSLRLVGLQAESQALARRSSGRPWGVIILILCPDSSRRSLLSFSIAPSRKRRLVARGGHHAPVSVDLRLLESVNGHLVLNCLEEGEAGIFKLASLIC